MNILLFSRILEKTGVGNHINQLSRELARQGHRVMVVSGTKNQDLDNDVAFKHLQTLSKNPLVIFKSIQQLHAIITQNKIDVVHCHHRVAALFMKLYNMLYPHVPTVYTLHSAPIPSDFFHRILTFPGDHTIGVSSDVSQFLTTALGVSSQKVTTVLNGVNQEELFPLSNDEKIALQEKFQLTPDKTVLCMHSRIDEVKNHLLMVEAISMLSAEQKKKVVVLCSGEKKGPYYENVIATIDRLDLTENFRFVGWISPREILGLADFLFLPSKKEGFPLNVAEAFLMKIPVARSQTAGFHDQQFCLPISDSDPSDIVNIIVDVLENGMAPYSDRVQNAYDLATKKMTVEAMAKATLKVYEKVCGIDG